MNAANERLVRDYFERVWKRGETAAIAEMLAPDFVDHDPPPGFGQDRDANRMLAEFMLATMRDKRHRILALVSDGEMVAVRHETEWTQDGAFFGIPADGKRLTMKGLDLYRIHDGLIVECWHCEDVAGVMRQAGMEP